MTNSIQVFKFDERDSIRTVVDNEGNPWFVAKDVAVTLEIKNPRSTLALLDDDEKGVHTVDSLGGSQSMTIINEAGLYSLILRSRKPEAKKFKRWITHEVLPSIRKTGLYATPQTAEKLLNDPDVMIGILEGFKEEKARRRKAEKELAIAEPKAALVDAHYGMGVLTLHQFLSTFEGVDTAKVSETFKEMKLFYKTKGGYQVYSKFRDRYFKEKYNPSSRFYSIYPTQNGKEMLMEMYLNGDLPLKKGVEDVFDYDLPDIRSYQED